MLRFPSLRVLLTGVMLAVAMLAPVGAAQADSAPTPATVWDAMPSGTGYSCADLSARQNSKYIECTHINWGKRPSELPSRDSGFTTNHLPCCSDWWVTYVHELPDPRILGTLCDQGGVAFDPQCQQERKGKKINAQAIVSGDPDRIFASTWIDTDYSPGSTLVKGQWLMAANQRYGLTFQPDGNLVAYGPRNKVLWNSGTWGHPQANLYFTRDGSLVVQDPDGTDLWRSAAAGGAGARLVIQNDGNAVIYRADNTAAFWTGWDR